MQSKTKNSELYHVSAIPFHRQCLSITILQLKTVLVYFRIQAPCSNPWFSFYKRKNIKIYCRWSSSQIISAFQWSLDDYKSNTIQWKSFSNPNVCPDCSNFFCCFLHPIRSKYSKTAVQKFSLTFRNRIWHGTQAPMKVIKIILLI